MRCHNCLGATLYCTESPCAICAELIIQRGIVKVIYSREYRDRKPIERLARCGLEVFRLMPNGMLVNPLTNELVDVLSD
jgi:deoxycytidylate deaminase